MSRRGALTGGYYDTRRSRLDLQKGKMECIQQLQQQQREYEEHKAKLQNILLKRKLLELFLAFTLLPTLIQTLRVRKGKIVRF